MKKFVFSLNSLFELKKTLKDKAQAEYAAAAAALQNAVKAKEALERLFAEKTAEYEAKLRKGIAVGDIGSYGRFFDELGERIKAAQAEIIRAQRVADAKREELTEVFKEIEVLKKLQKKQYQEYLKEEEKKEKSVLDDIMSFNITEAGMEDADK